MTAFSFLGELIRSHKTLYLICMFNEESFGKHISEQRTQNSYKSRNVLKLYCWFLLCHCASCENKCENKLVRERESPNIYTGKWQVVSVHPY